MLSETWLRSVEVIKPSKKKKKHVKEMGIWLVHEFYMTFLNIWLDFGLMPRTYILSYRPASRRAMRFSSPMLLMRSCSFVLLFY